MHIWRALPLAVIFSEVVFAQGARYDSASTTVSGSCASGQLCPVLAIPGTSVSVCAGPVSTLGACQASPATTYKDFTATVPCANTAQMTPATGGACTPFVDGQGSFGFWVGSAGTFAYFLTLPDGSSYGPYTVTPGGGGAVGGGVTAINTTLTGNVINIPRTIDNNTFTGSNAFTGETTMAGVTSTAQAVSQTNGGATGKGAYIQLTPLTYPNSSCTDVFGNVVNQPVPAAGMPAFGMNDAVMWVSLSPLSGATPPGCLPSPFSMQQDYGLNVSTYVFSLVGFATDRQSFNSFESLGGGVDALTITAHDYVYPGEYSGTVANGPPDPWRRNSVVNTSGTAVTLVSGEVFFFGIQNPPFGYITINSVQYTITGFTDANHITLGSSAGVQSSVAAFVPGWGDGAISYSTLSNCLVIYSAGTWACSGGGSGTPGTPLTSVQYNKAGSFAGNAAFEFDDGLGQLRVCAALGGICTTTSGVDAQVFSSPATGVQPAVVVNGGTLIFGNGSSAFQWDATALLVSPVMSASGGTGIGTAVLSATTAGMFLSVNGSSPSLLGGGGGTPGAPVTSVQYNKASAFAGNTNFVFNDATGQLQVCVTLGGICTASSGVDAYVFSSSATGSAHAFTTVVGNAFINGDGSGNFLTINGGAGSPFTVSSAGLVGGVTFGSSATGSTHAFTTNSGDAFINGDGSGNFNTLNVGTGPSFTVAANGSLVVAGSFGLTNAGVLTVSSCSGCGGSGSPGSPSTSVQYNNSGAFAGNGAFEFNAATGNVSVCTTLGGICTATSGFNAQAFSSSATGSAHAFTTASGNAFINGDGSGNFNTINVGVGPVFQVSSAGSMLIAGSWGLTNAGVLTVSSCTGCGGAGGTPGSPSTSVQFNNSGAFAGNAAFVFNSGTGNLSVCVTLGGICTGTSGVNAQVFSSSATGGAHAFTTGSGNAFINGDGSGNFNTLNVGPGPLFTVGSTGIAGAVTYGSSATGSTHAFTTNSGNAFINGDGSGNFNTINAGAGNPFTVSSGGNVVAVALTTSGTATLNGNVSGSHGQNVGATDNPNWRSVSTGTNNGSVATGGAGATFSNSLSGDSAFFFDNAGVCKINSGIGTLFCASDRRLKQNITPLASALSTVMALQPSTWNWISNGTGGVGFIAQDVMALIPEAVSSLGTYYGLSKETLIPYMVKAMQEQQAQIDTLTKQVATLSK